MNYNDIPIRRKLMGAILFISSIVLLIMCSVYMIFEYSSYKNTLKSNVSTLAVIAAANSSAALAFQSRTDATETLNTLKANKHIVAACLYDSDGNLFATYPSNISPKFFPAKPQKAGYTFEESYLVGFEPVFQRSYQLGTLFIKSDMTEISSQIINFAWIAFILIAVLLFVAYILSIRVQRIISKPILSLKKTATMVSENNDYALRAVKASNDELGTLTDSFNQMLDQIEIQNLEIKAAAIESSKLAAIVESSNDAIVGMTLDGIINSWNDAAERMFHYKANEIIGQSIMILVPAEVQNQEIEILSGLKKGESVSQWETQRITKEKKLLDVSLTISPVKNAHGDIIGSSKIARDISEKKLEEQRKNDFIAMVSHELKTPLTSIRSYIQVLLAKAKTEQDEFKLNALTRADAQSKKMTTMINDFLNLTRLEEGKIQLTKELFDLHPVIQEVTADAQFLAISHTILFKGCDGVKVYADKDKIGQVMINLLSNAVKYSPTNSTILVDCNVSAGKIKVCIRDQGIGISREDQKKLFNRFYRVRNEKVKTVSGFGIGLYLVSEILRYHDSKIEVESEEGKGSTFWFMLDVK
ncbi:ATP-binding protein [Mucilaginibacter sp. UR6-11]|uniref:ATP-binding protein n=1 Tax=Mucilaginibacter sp. UR6-11 TaxID=1435644 RepID=UPI001E3AFB64|nr:ATP-binding protein [Mucilaginibacter sp. UR6-11]MCC8426512.1 PAS domain S-box protein [Mucilaginibacter sp. UR6-11]